MLPADAKDKVIAAVRSGRYSLLLGAGFSAESLGPAGTSLPTGDSLAAGLASETGLPAYPLAQLTLAMDPAQLARALVRRFKGCTASAGIKLASRFVWRHIFTLNVDDVLDDVYTDGAAQQRLRPATFKNDYFRPDDLRELPVIYLHGSVQQPDHGFVFSAEQYGASAASANRWLTILADSVATAPMIVIGAGLNEPDVFYYLKRREGLSSTASIAPSLYVSRELDGVKLRLCEKLGLIPVRATADEFFEKLLELAVPLRSPLQLLLPGKTDLFPEPPTEQVQRLFFRQWLLVEPGALPKLVDDVAQEPHLLSGVEPRWPQLERRDDIIRTITSGILEEVESWKARVDKPLEVRLLLSSPGEGKTTILMRVALELASAGTTVFFFNSRERIAVRETVAAIEASRRPVVLMIDHLGDHGVQFEEVLERLREKSLACFIVTAERQLRMRRIADVVPLSFLKQVPLPRLGKPEAELLVNRMREAGLLGLNAGRPTPELISRVANRELFTGVVLLNAASKQLGDVVAEELAELSTSARLLYAATALAHSNEYPIKSAILIRAAGMDASDASKVIAAELKGLLRPLPPFGEYFETRHSVIATEVIRQTPVDEKFRIFVSVARALSSYVNTKTYSRGTEEARLAARLLDYDATVRPLLGRQAEAAYAAIKDQWAWNNRYWVQLALLKISIDPLLALQYAETAVGIEPHYVAQTTRAKILFRLARAHVGSAHGARYLTDALNAVDDSLRSGRSVKRANLQTLDVGIRGTVEYFEGSTPPENIPDPSISARVKEYERQARDLFLGVEQRDLLRRWSVVLQPRTRRAPKARPRARARNRGRHR